MHVLSELMFKTGTKEFKHKTCFLLRKKEVYRTYIRHLLALNYNIFFKEVQTLKELS